MMIARLQKLGFTILACLLLGSSVVLAQEGPKPPPRPPIDGGGDNGGDNGGGDGGDSTGNGLGLLPATVSGYVYDYSGYMRAGGVIVVLDGGGWQAEAVTDANGYYRIGGLGRGSAVVNLRLPPGTRAVVFDWPVLLGQGADVRVDLGYYWGDSSPLPVLLTGTMAGNSLRLVVTNRTDKPISGGQLQVILPAHIRGEPGIQASQGFMALYDPHDMQIEVGELASQAEATVTIPLDMADRAGRSRLADPAAIRAIFTYDQQITPLMVAVEPGQGQPEAGITPGQAGGADQPGAAAAQLEPPVPANGQTTLDPLPVTGRAALSGPGLGVLLLAGLVLLGLAAAGWGAVRGRR